MSYNCLQAAALSWDFCSKTFQHVYSQKYIYSPACHHEIQGHPNKVSRKEVSKSRLWPGQVRGLQGCKERLIRLWEYRFLAVIQFLLTLFIFVFYDFEMFNKKLDKWNLHIASKFFTDPVLFVTNKVMACRILQTNLDIYFLLVLSTVWGFERGMNIMPGRSTELTAFSNICKDKPSFLHQVMRYLISVSAPHDVHRLSDEEYWDSQGFARDTSFNSNQADLLSHDGNTVKPHNLWLRQELKVSKSVFF